MNITHIEYLDRGKRGLAYTGTLKGKKVLIKEHNPDSTTDTISNEAYYLQRLNKIGIGPQFIAYEDNKLVREFIDGERIGEFLDHCSASEASHIILEVFDQCKRMDKAGINKFEMTNPYKHILINEQNTEHSDQLRVTMIDFERCKDTTKPKNVTQFCQYLNRTGTRKLLYAQGVFYDPEKIIELSTEYKREGFPDKIYKQIIQHFMIKELTFTEKVYIVLMRVPKGFVTSYRDLAHAIGSRNYRAIGQALKRNPYAPAVPCHRVVSVDGSIGGFMGETSGVAIQKKIAVLAEEKVQVKNNRIVDFEDKRFSFSSSSS